MELLEELSISNVFHLSKNIMKYQALIYGPGTVQFPFTALKRLQAG
jgi:hypothetical protein